MNKDKSSMGNSCEFEISKLVAGYLTDSLPLEEKERFDKLLKSDSRLQVLLSCYNDHNSVQNRINYLDSLDIELSLQKVYKKSERGNSKSFKMYLPYAAVFVGFLLVTLWFLKSKRDPRIVRDTVYGYKNDVLPGEEKARLILSDGKVVELGSHSNSLIETDGSQLKENNGELSYFSNNNSNRQAFNTLVVPEAGTFRLILSDGTKVWLNANSKIEYPTCFIGNERVVTLTGEAYFEVAHNPKKPFNIHVNGSTITALGTSFNINSYNEKALSTTLISGKIMATSGLKKVFLEPGKNLLINKGGMTIGQANIEKELAWKNGYFSFAGESFYEAIQQIGRWYGVKIVCNGDIKDEQIGGSISRNVNLSEVIEMLKDVSSLTFEINGKELLVTKK